MAAQVILIRHGQTEWSLNGRHTSVTNLPLTVAGEKAGEALGERLAGVAIDIALSSPLQRAHETALRVMAGRAAELIITEDLVEWNYGDYEGLTTPAIRAASGSAWDLWVDGCPGGESPQDVTMRIGRLINVLDGLEGTVACFSHGHILRAVGALWAGSPVVLGGHLMLGTGAVCTLGSEREKRVIESWNVGEIL